LGAKVERQRREPSRGAESTKRDGVWEGASPSPQAWGRGSAPSAEIFVLIFWGSKWRIFVTLNAKFSFFL